MVLNREAYNVRCKQMKKLSQNIEINEHALADLCRVSGIARLSVFGSVLRQDFNDKSDVDLLVVFRDEAKVDLYDICVIRDRLSVIFGRDVDLVEENALVNPFRRSEIMGNLEVLYAA